MQRLERVSAAVANALRILPVAGEPGFMSPGGIAAGLADILRAHAGPSERLCIAAGAVQSLDADAAHGLAQATLADLSTPATELDLERQRQIDAWVRHCASRSPLEMRRARHG